MWVGNSQVLAYCSVVVRRWPHQQWLFMADSRSTMAIRCTQFIYYIICVKYIKLCVYHLIVLLSLDVDILH